MAKKYYLLVKFDKISRFNLKKTIAFYYFAMNRREITSRLEKIFNSYYQ